MKTQFESYLESVAMLSTGHLQEMEANLEKVIAKQNRERVVGLGLTPQIMKAVQNELARRPAGTPAERPRRIPS